MKLPVVIQHHPLGYVCEIPDEDWEKMSENAKPISDFHERTLKKIAIEMKKEAGEIPEKWRKPVKAYSGFVYGVYQGNGSISAEADTVEELLEILKSRATEMERGFAASAHKDWPTNFSIAEIEI